MWLCWVLVTACGIFSGSIWTLNYCILDLVYWSGMEPWPLHWELRVLATGLFSSSSSSLWFSLSIYKYICIHLIHYIYIYTHTYTFHGWMISQTQRTWVWASSRRRWRTGKRGVLQSMRSQKVGHDEVTGQIYHIRHISHIMYHMCYIPYMSIWIYEFLPMTNVFKKTGEVNEKESYHEMILEDHYLSVETEACMKESELL